MAAGIKSKFAGIGAKTSESDGYATEWNGIINELELINFNNWVDIGKNTTVNRGGSPTDASIIIGAGAKEEAIAESSSFGSQGRTVVGNSAWCADWRGSAYGSKCTVLSLSATGIGYGATIEKGNTHCNALGRGAHIPPNYGNTHGAVNVLGTRNNNDTYMGNGMFHSADLPTSGISIGDQTPSTTTHRWHGQDAFDAKATPTDFNIDGGHGANVAGIPTGTGTGGHWDIEVANGANLGANVKQATKVAARWDSGIQSANESNMLVNFQGLGLKRLIVDGDTVKIAS